MRKEIAALEIFITCTSGDKKTIEYKVMKSEPQTRKMK